MLRLRPVRLRHPGRTASTPVNLLLPGQPATTPVELPGPRSNCDKIDVEKHENVAFKLAQYVLIIHEYRGGDHLYDETANIVGPVELRKMCLEQITEHIKYNPGFLNPELFDDPDCLEELDYAKLLEHVKAELKDTVTAPYRLEELIKIVIDMGETVFGENRRFAIKWQVISGDNLKIHGS